MPLRPGDEVAFERSGEPAMARARAAASWSWRFGCAGTERVHNRLAFVHPRSGHVYCSPTCRSEARRVCASGGAAVTDRVLKVDSIIATGSEPIARAPGDLVS